MIRMTATAKGLAELDRTLAAEKRRQERALQTAVRVRGYKLMMQLRREIRSGAPGGQRFAPLSMIRRVERARFSKTGRLGANKPLAPLAKAVGYQVQRQPVYGVKIGFGVGRGLDSVTWRRLALMHQQGFETSVDTPAFRGLSVSIEKYFRRMGSAVDYKTFGKRKSARRKFFFLKKSTRTLKTPARPIIDPFIRANRADALRKIQRDFRAKMRGRRI